MKKVCTLFSILYAHKNRKGCNILGAKIGFSHIGESIKIYVLDLLLT